MNPLAAQATPGLLGRSELLSPDDLCVHQGESFHMLDQSLGFCRLGPDKGEGRRTLPGLQACREQDWTAQRVSSESGGTGGGLEWELG